MHQQIITIQTPKKYLLNGIFLGSEKAKNVYIYIHGLGGSVFSQVKLFGKMVDKDNAVLAFNNRGCGIVTRVKKLDTKAPKGYSSHIIGMAHEEFTDCVDDLEGAVQFVQKLGAKNIFLIGHSTGCQKSVYYLSQKPKAPVKGVILLAPMSDFADVFNFTDKKVYNRAVAFAQKMVKEGRGHELMPKSIWPYVVDAQRFLSLHTPDSIEEIFSYATSREPKLLKKVKQPILVVLAEEDEFKDRPMTEIADWFEENLKKQKHQIDVIINGSHYFLAHVEQLQKIIKTWANGL